MGKRPAKRDLGVTFEEASRNGTLLHCYQILGKYYTVETAHTAPDVQTGQCPVCADFSWTERTENLGECDRCGFAG
ncbi:MAG TPA: hypothetical protein VI895_08500 [Bdellovibrionota bacterium]|nr:hypothetical protein [Bdellovibrionota bacterium]